MRSIVFIGDGMGRSEFGFEQFALILCYSRFVYTQSVVKMHQV